MSFASGFMQAFGQGILQNQERQRNKELWDLQKKKMLADFELTKRKTEAMGDFASFLDPSLPPDQHGPVQEPTSIMDALSSPKGQRLALLSGMADLGDIQKAQQQKTLLDMLSAQGTPGAQGAQGALGAGVSGLEIDPIAAMGGQFKGVSPKIEEITHPDGSKSFIRIGGVTGQVMPVGGEGFLSAPSPHDMPIPLGDIDKIQTPGGGAPKLGTTFRDVMQAGTAAQPGEQPKFSVRPGYEKITMNVDGKAEQFLMRSDTHELIHVGQEKQAPITAEQGGKMSALVQGSKITDELINAIMAPDGTLRINAFDAFQMSKPDAGGVIDVASSKWKGREPELLGRILRRKFDDAIDAVIRARTGAAATEGEMAKLIAQFMPGVIDIFQPKAVQNKLNRLKAFLDGSLDVINLPDSLRRKIDSKYDGIVPSLKPQKNPEGIPKSAIFLGQRNDSAVWKLTNGELKEVDIGPARGIDLSSQSGGGLMPISQPKVESVIDDSQESFTNDQILNLMQYMTPEQLAEFE